MELMVQVLLLVQYHLVEVLLEEDQFRALFQIKVDQQEPFQIKHHHQEVVLEVLEIQVQDVKVVDQEQDLHQEVLEVLVQLFQLQDHQLHTLEVVAVELG
jgi:hypothetical protein